MSDFLEAFVKNAYLMVITTRSIELCKQCSGIGIITITSEECVDYHKGEYETTVSRKPCKMCKGDGRMVIIKEEIHIKDECQTSKIPFVDFTDTPYYNKTHYYKIRIDRNNRDLNRKYPKLAELTYDHYDKLADEYQLIETIKQEK